MNSDSYDANGNTTSSNSNTYAYDFENRLTSLNNGTATFFYDGDGNRVSKTVSGLTTSYLVDTNNHTGYAQVVEELQTGSVTKQFTYGHDLISQRIINGPLSFYSYDGHGSVRQLTDASAAVVTDTYTYDAFGILINRTGSTPNDYLYSGEQFDANLGFQYLRAHYLNPGSGTFFTSDSFEGDVFQPKSLHKYLYADADPSNRRDPSGHFSIAEAVQTLQLASLRVYTFVQFSRTIYFVKLGLQIANLAGLTFSEQYRAEFIAFGPEATTLVFDDLFEVVASTRNGIRSLNELLQLRRAYELEVRALSSFADELRASGKTVSEIAKEMTTARRLIGLRYKEVSPAQMQEPIFARNLERYKDPLGPTYEYFRTDRQYTDEQIIESTIRPDGGDLWWIWIARKLGLL